MRTRSEPTVRTNGVGDRVRTRPYLGVCPRAAASRVLIDLHHRLRIELLLHHDHRAVGTRALPDVPNGEPGNERQLRSQ